MSLDSYENDPKKRSQEQEKQQDFLNEKRLKRETSDLLNSLAKEIADRYGIDISEVKKMISGETLSGLENLKSSVSPDHRIDVPKLKQAIGDAQKKIEKLSASQRERLKAGLNPYPFTPASYRYSSQKLFSDSFIRRIEDPKGIVDELLGAGVGFLDSLEATGVFTLKTAKGIVVSPYSLYLLLTKKGKYENIKKL